MKNKLYANAGVNLQAGYETVDRIKKHIKGTRNVGVMSDIGSFGAMFDLAKYKFKDPVLVSGTDGVGTKLLLAIESNKHETIGQDLVAMCVNDVLALGAIPLFFLDYFATGKLKPAIAEKVIAGICDGCKLSGCALIGGETAEMPGMYAEGHYDLGGFVVGAAERSKLIQGEKNVKEGDVIIAIPSSGIHSNGYSLVRKIFKDKKIPLNSKVPFENKKLIDVLLTPTRIYVKTFAKLLKEVKVHGVANITGGGFFENIPRMYSDKLKFDIDFKKIKVLPIFKWMQELSKATQEEMFSTFNMGVGMVIAVDKKDVDKSIKVLKSCGDNAYVIGKIVKK